MIVSKIAIINYMSRGDPMDGPFEYKIDLEFRNFTITNQF